MNFDCLYSGYEYLRSESSCYASDRFLRQNITHDLILMGSHTSPRIIPPPFIRPTGQINVWIFMDSVSQSSLVSNLHGDDLHWQDEREMRDLIWALVKYLYGYLGRSTILYI